MQRSGLAVALLILIWSLSGLAPAEAADPSGALPRPNLDLPVSATEEHPVYLFEAAPFVPGTRAEPEGVRLFSGEITDHEGDTVSTFGDTLLCLHHAGYKASSATWRYRLDERMAPGHYEVWTNYTQGGVAAQQFTVGAGATAEAVTARASFTQHAESWQRLWRRGSKLTLYPGDTILEITMSGMATAQKSVEGFLLVRTGDLPAGMTAAGGQARLTCASFTPQKITRRLYVLEGERARDSDGYFQVMTGEGAAAGAGTRVTILDGEEARQVARGAHVPGVPALISMDDRYAVLGVLTGPQSAAKVLRFLQDPVKNGARPALPEAPEEAASPLHDGVPAAWLVAGVWGGPGGLSLYGLDTEPHLRPAPGDPVALSFFDRYQASSWRGAATTPSGLCVIQPATDDCLWSRGAAYAHLYVKADQAGEVRLHLIHTGIESGGWLEGQAVAFAEDPQPPSAFSAWMKTSPPAAEAGLTDQGNPVPVKLAARQKPCVATLKLAPGWHRLLLKLVMQQGKGEVFAFGACFTDAGGEPAVGLTTRLADPEANRAARAPAVRLTTLIGVDAPANLPRAGEPVQLRVDLRWLTDLGPGAVDPAQVPSPILPFPGKLVLTLTDYDGQVVTRTEITGRFPAQATVKLAKPLPAGYYAVQPTLYDDQGRLIATYPPDGFSVIGGTAAPQERKLDKKMAVTFYFMVEGYKEVYFPWMLRMGIYRNVGSHNAFAQPLWEAAKAQGLLLSADFWDYWNNESPESKQKLAQESAPYTRWFKSMNEIDIVPQRPTPERMVERTKWEYEAAHAARSDAVYTGPSLVRVGVDDWFEQCLKLGLDQYVDAWDVHAYPQRPPRLDGTIANSPKETELGVLQAYEKLGRTNTKPFWVGETGARASHGRDARRWQAETVAKMVAWANARPDIQVIGFLVPWESPRATRGFDWLDIPVAHQPAEAAYYTASALIDGFPCRRVKADNPDIDAAWFGDTFMIWTAGPESTYTLKLEKPGAWVRVEVDGRVRPLAVASDGTATLQVTGEPCYVLRQDRYKRLTR